MIVVPSENEFEVQMRRLIALSLFATPLAQAAPVVTSEVHSDAARHFAKHFTLNRYDSAAQSSQALHVSEKQTAGRTMLAVSDELGGTLWSSFIDPRNPMSLESIEKVTQRVRQALTDRQLDLALNDSGDQSGDGL